MGKPVVAATWAERFIAQPVGTVHQYHRGVTAAIDAPLASEAWGLYRAGHAILVQERLGHMDFAYLAIRCAPPAPSRRPTTAFRRAVSL